MLHKVFLLVAILVLGLSLFLIYEVSVLENEFKKLKEEIFLESKQSHFKDSDVAKAEMSKTWKEIIPRITPKHKVTDNYSWNLPFSRKKREQAQGSFLHLTANSVEKPCVNGSVTVIPWTVAVQQGRALLSVGNKIVVQEDGYYMVFGQVLFQSPGPIMGYLVRNSRINQGPFELLRCLQEMPQNNFANTCYTAGIFKLEQEDELELVILDRPETQISMDTDSTFFGIMQLN